MKIRGTHRNSWELTRRLADWQTQYDLPFVCHGEHFTLKEPTEGGYIEGQSA